MREIDKNSNEYLKLNFIVKDLKLFDNHDEIKPVHFFEHKTEIDGVKYLLTLTKMPQLDEYWLKKAVSYEEGDLDEDFKYNKSQNSPFQGL